MDYPDKNKSKRKVGRPKGSRDKLTMPEVRRVLFDALAAGDTVTEAAEKAGVAPSTVAHYRQVNDKFRDEFAAAYRAGADPLAAEARRRAVDGTAEPVYFNGKIVGTVTRKSDTLLMFLAKSRDPDQYCDRTRALRRELDAARAEIASLRIELERLRSDRTTAEPANRDAALAAIDALERLAHERAAAGEHAS